MVSVKHLIYLMSIFLLIGVMVFSSPGWLMADTNLLVNGDFSQNEDLTTAREVWYSDRENSGSTVIENGVANLESSDMDIVVDIKQTIETTSMDLFLTFDVIRKIDGNIGMQYKTYQDGYIEYMGGKYFGSADSGQYFTELGTRYRDNQLNLLKLWEQDPERDRMRDFDQIQIVLELDGEGEVWFDNVSLKYDLPQPPSRSLTNEDWVQKDLNISQLRQHYGSTDEGFIKFLYDNMLDRVWDKEGLLCWSQQLSGGSISASQLSTLFIFSIENQERIENMSHEEFINYLYGSLLARTPDSQGYKQWLDYMNKGMPKAMPSWIARKGLIPAIGLG